MKILIVFGTRPEAIKMAPVIKLACETDGVNPIVCVTGQHKEMLQQVLDFFDIVPDYDLELMEKDQNLYSVTIKGLKLMESVIESSKPDVILVQGDTTTSFLASLAGYYSKIKVAHLEAGLRSGNKYSPYPEEVFRILNGHIADWHFAPTSLAAQNLHKENIKKNVFVTGNTVIDALFLGLDIIKSKGEEKYYDYFKNVDFKKKIILVTSHRRENFGEPLKEICRALKDIANEYEDSVYIVFPVHLNPNVQKIVKNSLSGFKNILLIEPLSYNHMIWLMNKSYFIITDSGGVQEEAPSIGKPVLVTRDVTERVEGIESGTAKLVGADFNKITQEAKSLLEDKEYYKSMSEVNNPYGDGAASARVLELFLS